MSTTWLSIYIVSYHIYGWASIYRYWSTNFNLYHLYILDVHVTHTEFSWGFFSCVFSFLQGRCVIRISRCSDSTSMLRRHGGTRHGNVSQPLSGDYLFSDNYLTPVWFQCSIWNNGKPLFLFDFQVHNTLRIRKKISCLLGEIFILNCVQILLYTYEYLGEDYNSVYWSSVRTVSN